MFALFFVISRWVALQLPGWAALALEALGWMIILGAAAWVTRRWLAPVLVGAAGVLMTAGERAADRLVSSHNDNELVLGVFVSPLLSLAAAAFLIGAVALMLRSIVRDGRA